MPEAEKRKDQGRMIIRALNSIYKVITSKELANLAQVGTLALAAGAYFFTVIPVFQNQKLQEDNAKLELEKKEIVESTKTIQAKNDELEKKHQAQIKELEIQKLEIEKNKATILSIEKQLDNSKTLAQKASNELKSQLKTLDSARWKIIHDTLSTAANLNYTIKVINFNEKNRGQKGFMEGVFEWPGIEKTLDESILTLQKDNNNIPSEYIDKTIAFKNKNISKFECKPPNLKEIRIKYNAEILNASSLAKIETEKELERQKEDAEKKGKKLIITKHDIEALQNHYKSTIEFDITSKHNTQISDAAFACFDNIENFLKSFRQNFNVEKSED
jgi:hypothetical protein